MEIVISVNPVAVVSGVVDIRSHPTASWRGAGCRRPLPAGGPFRPAEGISAPPVLFQVFPVMHVLDVCKFQMHATEIIRYSTETN